MATFEPSQSALSDRLSTGVNPLLPSFQRMCVRFPLSWGQLTERILKGTLCETAEIFMWSLLGSELLFCMGFTEMEEWLVYKCVLIRLVVEEIGFSVKLYVSWQM